MRLTGVVITYATDWDDDNGDDDDDDNKIDDDTFCFIWVEM